MENQEIWKDIKDYEGLYRVSNLGNIKSLARFIDKGKYGKIYKDEQYMKTHSRNIYLQVTLCKNGKYKVYYVHRLVAQAFIPNPNNLEFINHKDGNKTNNNVDNLEWCTKSYNLLEAYRLGLKKPTMSRLNKFGKESKNAKEILQIDKNGNTINNFYGSYEAERITGIDKSNIIRCCKGKGQTAGGYYWKYKIE